jgi:uncharacterized protein (TIGR03083 family)
MVREERDDFMQFLDGLTAPQWEHRTLCERWRVRDVVAHVVSFDDLGWLGLAKNFIKGRMMPARMNAIAVAGYAAKSPADLCRLMREHAQPRGYMAAFGGVIGLLDAMIHQQDIRRPLGMPRDIPAARLRAALNHSLYVPPPLCGAWRARGLRLVAVDVDCTHGHGAEVRGEGEALLMALAGRRAAFADLIGPGKATLLGRI